MRVSVILATYNRLAVLQRCLQALNTQQEVDLDQVEVLVVDDGSSDGTWEWLNKVKSEKLKVKSLEQGAENTYRFHLRVFQQDHAGQGNARNLALDQARGDIIFFIGDDIFFEKNTLAQHLLVHEKYPEPEYAVLGHTTWHTELQVTPFMYFLEHGGHQFAYGKIKGETLDSRLKIQERNSTLYDANYWFFYTSNISLKRALIEDSSQSVNNEIAAPDETRGQALASFPRNDEKPVRFESVYTSYGWEDIDFGYRLEKERGMKILYNPQVKALHYHEVTMDGFRERMQSIAKNALVFHERFPEVPVLPTGLKKFIFQILSSDLSIFILQNLAKISARCEQWYFYALMKKYWLEGLENS